MESSDNECSKHRRVLSRSINDGSDRGCYRSMAAKRVSAAVSQAYEVAKKSNIFSHILSEAGKFAKLPWKAQGPLAAKDWLPSLAPAGEYRPITPATISKIKPLIPHAEPENVYNINYFKRERRRGESTHTFELVDPHAPLSTSAASAPGQTPEAEPSESPPTVPSESPGDDLPPTPGKYYKYGYKVHLNDVQGGGYCK